MDAQGQTMNVNTVTTLKPQTNNKKYSKHPNFEDSNAIRLSFQIMTRAEPIQVVIATIKSLLAIKSAADEIVIIDNNHTDKALYEPLAHYCDKLTEQKVRFYHVDKVDNFKSGALNLALELMDAQCSHIVVVDSDYQALPHARAAITNAIQAYPEHALLQFPQFYRDEDRLDVHSELNHYFNYHLYRPFNRQRALSTGTFAVIRRDALIELGGWSGASITEDAQMGVLMHRQGFSSEFIPEVIATGLLPTTLPDLVSQRQRWIYGNMQVLTSYFCKNDQTLITDRLPFNNLKPSLSKYERLNDIRAHLSQLSAWVNFTGLFILLQLAIVITVVSALLFDFKADFNLLLLPLYAVYTSYAIFLARRFWAYSQDKAPLNKQVADTTIDNNTDAAVSNNTRSFFRRVKQQTRAWLLHLNFWELGALSWLPVLWGQKKPFVCTPKQVISSTTQSRFIANFIALPKLLLGLNIITALLVAPFSTLYSPLLFISALIVCVIKILAANVILDNYRYKKTNARIIKFAAHANKKPLRKSRSVNSLTKAKSANSQYRDNKMANS